MYLGFNFTTRKTGIYVMAYRAITKSFISHKKINNPIAKIFMHFSQWFMFHETQLKTTICIPQNKFAKAKNFKIYFAITNRFEVITAVIAIQS